MTDEDCLFCKISAGEIPADIIYETENVVAFRDINPQAPTHALIIPRKHIATINDLTLDDNAEIGKLFLAAAAIARKIDGASAFFISLVSRIGTRFGCQALRLDLGPRFGCQALVAIRVVVSLVIEDAIQIGFALTGLCPGPMAAAVDDLDIADCLKAFGVFVYLPPGDRRALGECSLADVRIACRGIYCRADRIQESVVLRR